MLVGYADDSTLFCRIPHPRDWASVAELLNGDLDMMSDWWSWWGMLVNPSKTRGMLISRSRMDEPLVIDGLWVEDFGCHSWLQVGSEQLLLLLRGGSVFWREDNECFQRCRSCGQMLLGIHTSCAEVLFPSLDVKSSTTTSHLLLLDRVVGRVIQFSDGSVNCDLWHRHRVAFLCVFFKIDSFVGHPVSSL